jgi:hypothetical protein
MHKFGGFNDIRANQRNQATDTTLWPPSPTS